MLPLPKYRTGRTNQMFNRKVKIEDRVYSYHFVTEIRHLKDVDTSIFVTSSNKDYIGDGALVYGRILTHEFDDTLTFEQAEEYVKANKDYEVYVDPADAIIDAVKDEISDDQASTIIDYYPVWDLEASYKAGNRVRYLDGFYRCLQDHTAQESWNPIDAPSLWAAIIDATVPGEDYPEWIQPDSTNPYAKGDRVTHDSHYWESDVDGNVWEPGVYGWTEFDPDVEPEPEPTPEPEPEPEPEDIPEWVQPDATNPYMTGDKVVFDGQVYESLIDNNTWSPADYPAGWQLTE